MMNLKQHFKQNAAFYKDLWIIALPIALQQLVTSSLNMVDTLMVGKVGVDAVAAVGVSNQYYFLLNMVMFGIYSGGMVYFAQFWGKKEIRNIHRLLGFTLVLGMSCYFYGLSSINSRTDYSYLYSRCRGSRTRCQVFTYCLFKLSVHDFIVWI